MNEGHLSHSDVADHETVGHPRISPQWAQDRFSAHRNAHDTAQVWRLATEHNLDVIIFKGITTQRLRPERGWASADVDLLVAPHHRRVLDRALVSTGYQRRRGSHGDTWHGPGLTEIDVHHTICRAGASPREVWRVLSTHTRTMSSAGENVRVFDPGAQLVTLAIVVTQGRAEVSIPDLRAATEAATEEDLATAVAVAAAIGVSATVSWALHRSGLPDIGNHFGRPQLAVTSPSEQGWWCFATSPVHPYERGRKLAKLTNILTRKALARRWPELAWGYRAPDVRDPDAEWRPLAHRREPLVGAGQAGGGRREGTPDGGTPDLRAPDGGTPDSGAPA